MDCVPAVAIEMATKDNVDWLLHIDTDELMYPGGSPSFSLQDVLAAFPDDVDTVVFPNYESLPESSKVHDPFTEVMRPCSHLAGSCVHFCSVILSEKPHFVGLCQNQAYVQPCVHRV